MPDKPVLTWQAGQATICAGDTWLSTSCAGTYFRLRGESQLAALANLLGDGLYDNRCASCRPDNGPVCAINPGRDQVELFLGGQALTIERRLAKDVHHWLCHCLKRPLPGNYELNKIILQPGRVFAIRPGRFILTPEVAAALARRLLAAAADEEQPDDNLTAGAHTAKTIFSIDAGHCTISLKHHTCGAYELSLGPHPVVLWRGALAALARLIAAGEELVLEERDHGYRQPDPSIIGLAFRKECPCSICAHYDGHRCRHGSSCDAKEMSSLRA